MVNIATKVKVRGSELDDYSANETIRLKERPLRRDHLKEVSVKRFQNKYNQIFQEMDSKPSYPDNLNIENKNQEILARTINLINRKDLKSYQRMDVLNRQIDAITNRMDYLNQMPGCRNNRIWQSKFTDLKGKIGKEMGNMVTGKMDMNKGSDLSSRVAENKGILKRAWGFLKSKF